MLRRRMLIMLAVVLLIVLALGGVIILLVITITLVVAYAVFLFMPYVARLRADGWSLVHNQGFKYWSQRRYEKR